MPPDEPVPLSPAGEAQVAAATAVATAQEASRAEAVESIENVGVRRAQEATEAAEQAASDIALAAMHTQLGQLIESERTARNQWEGAHDQTHLALMSEIATIKTRMDEIIASMAEAISRLPPVAVVTEAPVSLTPAASAETVIVNPAESPAPIAASPEAPAPTRRKIRLI